MAAGVVVVTEVQPEPPNKIAIGGAEGGLTFSFFDITLDTSYPTGGSAIAINRFGLLSASAAVVFFSAQPKAGYVPVWDYTNNKLLVYRDTVAGDVLVQVTADVDIHAVVARCLVIGRP